MPMTQKALPITLDESGAFIIPAGNQVGLPLTPKDLTQEQIADIRLAASRMGGFQRRGFMAEMSLKYCNGSPRLTENVFSWPRDAVEAGLGEKRTGIRCIGFQSSRCGNKPWEGKHPEMAEFLCRIAEGQSQQDPTFQSAMAFTRLTAQSALNALLEAGFGGSGLPSLSSMAEILNRLGYRLRKVVKAKPPKKIGETGAIFENIKKKTRKPKVKMARS